MEPFMTCFIIYVWFFLKCILLLFFAGSSTSTFALRYVFGETFNCFGFFWLLITLLVPMYFQFQCTNLSILIISLKFPVRRTSLDSLLIMNSWMKFFWICAGKLGHLKIMQSWIFISDYFSKLYLCLLLQNFMLMFFSHHAILEPVYWIR